MQAIRCPQRARNWKAHKYMIQGFKFKDYFATVFNHGLDLAVKITDVVRAMCL